MCMSFCLYLSAFCFNVNKKVLLRERKRHTARRVVSTPSVVLPGYPPRGGTRSGTPQGGTRSGPPPRGGVPSQVPPGGYPVRYPPGGVPSQVPPPGGYPVRYPPPAAPWHSGKCCKALWDMGTPPILWTDKHLWKQYLPVVLRTRAVIICENYVLIQTYRLITKDVTLLIPEIWLNWWTTFQGWLWRSVLGSALAWSKTKSYIWKHINPKCLFTPSESGNKSQKRWKNNQKRSHNKPQTSKKAFAFSFAFAWCEWVLSS